MGDEPARVAPSVEVNVFQPNWDNFSRRKLGTKSKFEGSLCIEFKLKLCSFCLHEAYMSKPFTEGPEDWFKPKVCWNPHSGNPKRHSVWKRFTNVGDPSLEGKRPFVEVTWSFAKYLLKIFFCFKVKLKALVSQVYSTDPAFDIPNTWSWEESNKGFNTAPLSVEKPSNQAEFEASYQLGVIDCRKDNQI